VRPLGRTRAVRKIYNCILLKIFMGRHELIQLIGHDINGDASLMVGEFSDNQVDLIERVYGVGRSGGGMFTRAEGIGESFMVRISGSGQLGIDLEELGEAVRPYVQEQVVGEKTGVGGEHGFKIEGIKFIYKEL